jgi:hypothetical protein
VLSKQSVYNQEPSPWEPEPTWYAYRTNANTGTVQYLRNEPNEGTWEWVSSFERASFWENDRDVDYEMDDIEREYGWAYDIGQKGV